MIYLKPLAYEPHFTIDESDVVFWDGKKKQYALRFARDESAANPRVIGKDGNLVSLFCKYRNHRLGDYDPDVRLADWLAEQLRRIPEHELARRIAEKRFSMPGVAADRDVIRNFIEDVANEAATGFPRRAYTVLSDFAAILPLWVYDNVDLCLHADLNARTEHWDKCNVGFACVMKQTILDHIDGACIDGADEANWRGLGYQRIGQEIDVYNDYLSGNTWLATLYTRPLNAGKAQADNADGWSEVSTYGSYYGDNLLTNGMLRDIDGLDEAIGDLSFDVGKLRLKQDMSFEFVRPGRKNDAPRDLATHHSLQRGGD